MRQALINGVIVYIVIEVIFSLFFQPVGVRKCEAKNGIMVISEYGKKCVGKDFIQINY